ncbi:hypothetical protein HYN48_02905 [Flavobacterium magnum]|uniref:Protein BatD n=1 Tax=Flavobacterium magnum TaxID=2162713 RepID=A0A2S0RC50_9FLAO|nr:hypothetical protein [Flavobacterium magnum]AWA29119.1 hypothetical protein HYN48_02905 [Flavobacterium magnum]
MKKNILSLILSLAALAAFPQQGKITTGIDKKKQKIGAQFNLTLKTTVDTTAKVVFPKAPNFGSMMVIRDEKPDTVKKGARYELVKKYGLTQFDSGSYLIPKLKVLINKKPFFSDSLRVEVANVKVDTLKQGLYDIKPTIQVETPPKSWWWWCLAAATLIVIAGALAYYVFGLFKNKKIQEDVYKTPIEKATSLLKNLENKQLWQKGEVKSYYSELTDIARNYIEEEIHIPAMESTTTELIEALRKVANQKKMTLSQDTFINLEKVLKQADLVKFAKSKPQDFEILEDKKRVESSIVLIHKAVPEEVIEEDTSELDELMKARLLKKKKRKNAIVAAASILGVLVVSLGILISVKGLDYVLDNTFGHPTKTLLEGEWITSEYGNPAIQVQTPEVLKRINAKDFLPKDAMQLIKDMQTFQYGNIYSDFGIMVATNTYKDNADGKQPEINLDNAIEGEIKLFEKKGAQRITVFKEDYTDKDGSVGMKAYGTYIRVDAENRKSIKMAYEMIYFHQGNGLQKVIVVHQEDDKYAKPLTDKLMKSVELITETP